MTGKNEFKTTKTTIYREKHQEKQRTFVAKGFQKEN